MNKLATCFFNYSLFSKCKSSNFKNRLSTLFFPIIIGCNNGLENITDFYKLNAVTGMLTFILIMPYNAVFVFIKFKKCSYKLDR